MNRSSPYSPGQELLSGWPGPPHLQGPGSGKAGKEIVVAGHSGAADVGQGGEAAVGQSRCWAGKEVVMAGHSGADFGQRGEAVGGQMLGRDGKWLGMCKAGRAEGQCGGVGCSGKWAALSWAGEVGWSGVQGSSSDVCRATSLLLLQLY